MLRVALLTQSDLSAAMPGRVSGAYLLKYDSAGDARQISAATKLDGLLVDEFLPSGGSGIALISRMRRQRPELEVALLVSSVIPSTAVWARQAQVAVVSRRAQDCMLFIDYLVARHKVLRQVASEDKAEAA